MRITGGRLVRRPLAAPRGDATRPTTDRTREALFSALGHRLDLNGARVADLFAGSGALGLEALSRGAAHATFVERHGPTLAVARANAASLGVERDCAFVRADVLVWLARAGGERFDVVFADPPYALDAIPALPDLVQPLLAPGGALVLEHDARHAFRDAAWTRTWGRTVVSLFDADAAGDAVGD